MFTVNVIARNPKQEELATQPLAALVDTESELTWLPAEVLKSAGILPLPETRVHDSHSTED